MPWMIPPPRTGGFRSVRGTRRDLLAFVLTLSFSRARVLVWSERRHLLAWLSVHNAALERLGGVPATIRVDNEKTAVVAGAGGTSTVGRVDNRHGAYYGLR